METSFLLVESDWPCERVRRLVDAIFTRWVVVHRTHNGEDLYYIFKHKQLVKMSASGAQPVGVALNLHETDTAPTSTYDSGKADRPTVVVSRGRVAGIMPPVVLSERPEGFDWRDDAPAVSRGIAAPEVSRAIEASAPRQVTLGDTVPLIVKLVSETSQADALRLKAFIGEGIDVVVQASGGLQVEGKANGTLRVVEASTPMLLFKIVGKAIGLGEVSVLVFQRGQSVGSIEVALQTVPHVSEANITAVTTCLQNAPAKQPDLQLLVLENGSGSGLAYKMWFIAADPALNLNFAEFKFSMKQDPRAFFDKFYAEIEAILTSSATAQQKLQRLSVKGTYLFEELMPPEARATLWGVRERIRSVHVQSEEPWVPWELVKLAGDDGNGTVIEAGFLCEDYEFTRWVPRLGYRHDLTMDETGVIIPADSGLTASLPERDAILALATPQRHVTPIQAEEVTVRKVLAGGTLDVIHFIGHGVAGETIADRAEIRLGDGSRLRPEDLTGNASNLGRRSPIVFLNACEVGRAGMGLTRPGGWPRFFLAAGAGAFVAPFWKVADASAAAFATSFYQELIGGASVGTAARTARLSIQAASDPTWLAYSVYAHCDARLL